MKLTIQYFLMLVAATGNIYAHYNSKGPFGGTVTCSVVADTNVYLGTENGGVFRSTNSKVVQWKPVPLGLKSGKITCLAYADGIVYAGTADSGIFISVNAGSSWTQANTGLTEKKITSLCIKGNDVFTGTQGGGIFISQSRGSSWYNTRPGGTVQALASNNQLIVAGTDGGVLYSSDGILWKAGEKSNLMTEVTSFAFGSDQIFAGTRKNGVFQSSLDSLDWQNFNTGLNNLEINHLFIKDLNIYASTNAGIFSSPETSVQWQTADEGIKSKKITTISWSGKFIAGTVKEGVYVTANPKNGWLQLISGFNNLATYATLAIDTNIIMAATEQGIFISRNVATSYVRSNKGISDSLNVTAFAFDNRILYAATANEGMFVSSDTGKSWRQENNMLTDKHIEHLLIDKSRIFVSTSGGNLFYTKKGAIAWIPTFPKDFQSRYKITCLASDGENLYFGTNTADVLTLDAFYEWKLKASLAGSSYIISLAVNKSEIFAASDAGIQKADLLNAEFTPVNGNLPSLAYTLVSYSGILFAGIKSGVYYTADNGNIWNPAGTQDNYPTFAEARHIAFVGNGNETTGRLFATTPSNSLYSNSLSELPVVLGIEDKNYISRKDNINIFPNPNSGNFVIRSANTVDKCELVNSEGITVASFKIQNSQEVNLNLSPGIYFLKTSGANVSEVQKLIIQ